MARESDNLIRLIQKIRPHLLEGFENMASAQGIACRKRYPAPSEVKSDKGKGHKAANAGEAAKPLPHGHICP